MKHLLCCYAAACLLLPIAGLLLATTALRGQSSPVPGKIASVQVRQEVRAERGSKVKVPVLVSLPEGYHVNSNQPRDKFLKPLSLTWASGPLVAAAPVFPKALDKNYSFSDRTLSVYEGSFEIVQEFEIPKDAPAGKGSITGKLAYQACTESECYPPSSTALTVSYEIR